MAIPHCGGASTHIELLLRNLSRANISAHLLAGNVATPLGVRVLDKVRRKLGDHDESRRIFLLLNRLQKQIQLRLKEHPYDLVHAQDPTAAVAARLAAGDKTPVALTVHGPLANESRGITPQLDDRFFRTQLGLEQMAYSAADWVIGVDEGQLSHARIHGARPARACVVPNAVDADALCALAFRPAPHFTRPQYPYAFTSRRLVPKNGVLSAIKAYCASSLPVRGAHFLIAGGGPERSRLQQYLTQQPVTVSDMVHLLGAVAYDDSIRYTYHADVVMVPSIAHAGVVEATSLSLLEAMALGKAVVASDLGGLHDVLFGTCCGVLVAPGNEMALRSALDDVISRRDWAESMGERAKALVGTKYGMDQWVDKHADVYRRILFPAALKGAGELTQRAISQG